MIKSKALGRGLEALLGEMGEVYENEIPQNNTVLNIDIKRIRPNPFQPRKYFNETSLLELGESIKNDGLLQPIVVTEDIDGYILISGERRVRASKLVKLKRIKGIVIHVDKTQIRQLSLIENIQRDQLNSIELAEAYSELIKLHHITHDELANMIHKSRVHITNSMRLLQLTKKTQKALIDKKISAGHAKILVGLDDYEQKMIVDSIVGQKLSVRDVEKMIKSMKVCTSNKIKKPSRDNYNTTLLQDKLSSLGLQVVMKSNKLIINFSTQAQIDKLTEKFL